MTTQCVSWLRAAIAQSFAHVKRQKSDLRPYQRYAVRWLYEHPYSALLVDMGLGKTVIVLTLIVGLLTRFGFRRCLIIAPIKVANETWPSEIREWQHTACLPFAVLTGDRETRLAAMRDPATIHIINREAVPWLVEAWGAKNWPYDVVIFDESSRLRDHNSQVFKAMKTVRPRMRRMHQLTATPAAQSYMHLFAQVWLLDRGQRLGSFITHFRKTYFDHDTYSMTYTLKDGAKEKIAGLISDVCLVMQRKDYLDMPDAVVRQRPVYLTEKQTEQYARFEREFILDVSEDQLIEAHTRAALAQKLLQLASGAVYDENRLAHVIHNHKIEALREIVDEAVGQPLLVAYWHQSSRERLLKAFPQAVLMDRAGKAVKPWNERKIPMLLVHPQSAAHGLNLQFGGHHIVMFDVWHSLELFQQLIKRLDRPGQTEVVIVQMLTALGTADETVAARLEVLEDAQEDLFQMLKAARRRAERREAA